MLIKKSLGMIDMKERYSKSDDCIPIFWNSKSWWCDMHSVVGVVHSKSRLSSPNPSKL